jgi:PKD repeat protein
MNSSSTWFWGIYGEADVPGAVQYSIASSSNIGLINSTAVASGLLQFQKSNGGFEGYYDLNQTQTVTSSVDTDMALLGLVSSDLISAQNRTLAIQYLLTLQNPDGSFNLTSTRPYDPIYSLGPDPVSITALTLLALKSVGFAIDNVAISSGVKFLSEALLANFCGNGHVYSTALSTLVFKAYAQPYEEATSTVYLLSQQNSDGGFSDSSRSSYAQSDALDTGWAAIALETPSTEQVRSLTPINCPPVAAFTFNPHAPAPGAAVHFNADMSNDPDKDQLSYNWTFGDGSSAKGVSPTHTYTEAGSFTVTLTAVDSGTNPGPLSNTKSLTITVRPTTVQKSPALPIHTTALWILSGAIGLVAIIGVAFYSGRRSARGSSAPLRTDR